MTASRRGKLALLCLLVSCSDLTPIPADRCGNKVHEPAAGEECDGEANCRPPGDDHACRFACSAQIACPDGYRCGLDGLCRIPSGVFRVVDGDAVPTFGLSTGDFDADGRRDLVRTGSETTFLHFYDATGEPLAVTSVLREPTLPAVGDVTGDGRDDIAFRTEIGHGFSAGLAVLRSKADRSLVGTTYTAISVPATEARGVSATVFPPYNRHELIAFLDQLVVGITNETTASTILPSPSVGAADIVGITVGDFDEDTYESPCDEVAFAGRGDDKLYVFTTCARAGDGTVEYSDIDDPPSIALPGGSTIFGFDGTFEVAATTEGLLNADWNGDAHLDLLIVGVEGGAPRLYLSYGVGDGSFHGSLPVPAVAGDMQSTSWQPDRDPKACSAELGIPLAAADFNRDGLADVVTQTMVLVSTPDGPNDYEALYCAAGWTRAVVGDFDGNGESDIVAARSGVAGLDFLAGAGDGTFARSSVPSNRRARQLVSGDFDGDQHADAAFVAPPLGGESLLALMVTFGRPGAPPDVPIVVGELANVEMMGSGRHEGDDATSDIAVLRRRDNGSLALAVIAGDARRQLQAPLVFPVTKETRDSTVPVPVVTNMTAVVHGRFGAPGELTMAAVTQDHPDFGGDWRVWRLRASGEADFALSRASESEQPTTALECQRCSAAALDLDGDAQDELVTFRTPEMVIYRITDGELTTSAPVGLSRPLPDPLLELGLRGPRVRDVDGDGLDDVALLDESGSVLLFWNDGSGTLGEDRMTVLESPDPERRALDLAFLHADGDEALDLVIVTPSEGVLVLGIDGPARSFRARDSARALALETPGTLLEGELLASGDFDGDRIDDLAVGDFDGFSLLRGGALRP
jgi:hypothetical protein